jgi:TolA-binding protein
MAAGTIITVLSNVPWGQVIDAAPKVAEGASKLWGAVTGRKKAESDRMHAATGADSGVPSGQGESVPQLRAEVRALQGSVEELREELLEATALIKQLAEQNKVLVQRVEFHRKRLAWVTFAGAMLGAALLLAVVQGWLAR